MSRSKGWVLAAWLCFLLACGLVIARIPVASDLSAFLPRTPSAKEKALVDQLSVGTVSRLVLIGLEGAPAPVLAATSRALADRLRPSPLFLAVRNGPQDTVADRAFLWRNRYLLSPGVTAARFSKDGLRQALQDDLRQLSSSMAMLTKTLLPADPTGEMLRLVEPLAALGTGAATRQGVWFSPTGDRALLIVQTRAGGFDADAELAALAAIKEAFGEIQPKMAEAGAVRLILSGPAVFSVETRNRIESDAWHLSLTAMVAICLLLLLARPSPVFLVLALLPAATGIVGGMAAVGLRFGSIHGTTLGFGATLIGEAVDYAVYLVMQTPAGGTPAQTLRRIGPVLRLGMLTSAFGFSPLLTSRFPGLAQLGVFSIAGLLVALGTTFFLLPTLWAGPAVATDRRAALSTIIAARRWLPQLRPLAIIAVAAASGMLVLRRDTLWDDSLAALSPIPRGELALYDTLRRELGAPDISDIVVTSGADAEQALRHCEATAAILRRAMDAGVLSGFTAPCHFLPSLAAQQQRQVALPAPDVLQHNLDAALDGLPFRAGLFEPFLHDVAMARTLSPVSRKSLGGTTLALQVDTLLSQHEDGWIAVLPVRGVSPGRLNAVIGGAPPGTVLVNLKQGADSLYRDYRKEAAVQASIGGLAIVLLLAVRLASARRVARVMVPLGAAVIVTACLVLLSGQRLSIFHLVGLLLVVGVGSNYCLFLEHREAERDRIRTGFSLVLANACTVLGFGILSLSRIAVLHGIGMTVGMGALLSLLFAMIFDKPIARSRKGAAA